MTIPLRGAWIMQHKSSHHFLGYWDKLRDANALPDWTDFDPRAIKDLLPNVLILDVQNMAQPKYRYAGTALCERHGCDLAAPIFFQAGTCSRRAQLLRSLAVQSNRNDPFAFPRLEELARPESFKWRPFWHPSVSETKSSKSFLE